MYKDLFDDLSHKIKHWAIELKCLDRVPALTKIIGEMIECSENIHEFRIKHLGEEHKR